MTGALANRLTPDGTYSYSYDNEGNITRRTPLADISALNPVVAYGWDHHNRLVTVRKYASVADANAGQNSIANVDYAYDVRGRRVMRTYDANGAGAGQASSEYFVYNGSDLSMRFGNAGELTHRYLDGPLVDQVLVDESFKAATSGQRVTNDVLWELADHQGSVRDVVGNNGVLRRHTNYDAFGQVKSETYYAKNGSEIDSLLTEAVDALFGHTGQERDTATGLQYHSDGDTGRWYDPRTGRWLSEDPIFAPNLYPYVSNDPVNNVDPTGASLVKPTQSVTGFGAGSYNPYAQSLAYSSTPLITGPSPIVSQPSASPRFLSSPIDFQPFPQGANAPINKLDEIFMKEELGQTLSGWEIATKRILAKGPEGIELLQKNPVRVFRIAQLAGGDSGIGNKFSSTSPAPVRSGETSLHTVVDAVGFIPGPTGMVANGANAVSYAYQGDATNAGLAMLAMIPFEKPLAKGFTALKAIVKEAKAARTVETALVDAAKVGVHSANPTANVVTQSIGDLRAAGLSDAHHVIQDAAVRDLPGYSTTAARGVQLSGPSTATGTSHYVATQVQRQSGGGTYAAERRIGYKALRQAGYSEVEARQVIQEADNYFAGIGVQPNTPTRIPGNR